MSQPLLQLEQVTIRFGGLTAIAGFDFAVGQNELVGLIGPNGAGKTTVFNLVTGVYQPTSGEIRFETNSIAGFPPHRLAHCGIARTFQNIRLFGSLSVSDNVRAGLQLHRRHGFRNALWRGREYYRSEKEVASKVIELLDLFGLAALHAEPARSLAYGDQRRLEIVRALATQPKLLLLDEPAAGMNPTEKASLAGLIRSIRDRFQLSIFLVEHDMPLVMNLCQRLAVLDYGVKIAEGTPAEIRRNPKVIAAYLGEESENVSPESVG